MQQISKNSWETPKQNKNYKHALICIMYGIVLNIKFNIIYHLIIVQSVAS